MKDKDFSPLLPATTERPHDNLLEESENRTINNWVLKVVFKNEHYLKKYKTKLETVLKEIIDDGDNFVLEHEFEQHDQSFHIDRKQKINDVDSNTEKSVPFYSNAYEDVLQDPEPETKEEPAESNKPQTMTCFNCLGDHHMRDCPEKVDHRRVAANKKDMMAFNTSRYHEEERRNAFKPGSPSVELRNAMGLKEYQLPRYIYVMRVIGYPPGWMQEAVHETSGLSLYDNSESPSEKCFSSTNDRDQYDTEKFVNYPGFNSPVPNGFRDEWQQVGWLPMQKHQQLSEVLKSSNTISPANMYKRKSLSGTDNAEIKKSKNGTDNVPDSSWEPENSSTPKQLKSKSKLRLSTFESPIHESNSSFLSLSKSPGTPVVDHGNPYLRLPDANKFAHDITEHLPFENLPDAVGKYENMRNVLSNVQKKLKGLNQS